MERLSVVNGCFDEFRITLERTLMELQSSPFNLFTWLYNNTSVLAVVQSVLELCGRYFENEFNIQKQGSQTMKRKILIQYGNKV